MCYLAIKELANIAEDVIIVTSSLTKDMTGKEDMFRASAIRALCKITDSQMLAGIERYLKQAIVDKNSSVSSAALVSALVRLFFKFLQRIVVNSSPTKMHLLLLATVINMSGNSRKCLYLGNGLLLKKI